MRRRPRARFLPLTAASALTALVVAACGTGSASTTSSSSGTNPIIIGTTEPLTGAFSADGSASLRGDELWVSDVNSHGGLLGRPVQLKILNDNSDPNMVTKDYTQLITQDHVDLTLAPFSSLLTVQAAQVTKKYHYALPEGSGSAPSVYSLNDPYLFAVSPPVSNQMVPFAQWVLSLPPGQRPTSAAYPMVADPFADPPVQTAAAKLHAGGIKTVYYSNSPVTPNATDSNLTPIADAVAAKNPQMVVLGTIDVPSLLAFIHAFEAAHFTPNIMIASSGPDQGQEFLNHVGKLNAEGIMVPDGWYGGVQNALSHVMVQNYIAKYGGTTSDINADVAEAYSAGEVLADAVTGTHSLSNSAIASYLHSHTLQTVQGTARFQMNGANPDSQVFIFQWQNGQFTQVLQSGSVHSANIEVTKPHWQGG
ncbi:MAG TPA: amino acid ABC transporter substrate-binding protein [Streptosporangiaceae bacterium]|nr:amino acid ABC transporter substrate-binding protein [Streptosporangiaceae bacterium]